MNIVSILDRHDNIPVCPLRRFVVRSDSKVGPLVWAEDYAHQAQLELARLGWTYSHDRGISRWHHHAHPGVVWHSLLSVCRVALGWLPPTDGQVSPT